MKEITILSGKGGTGKTSITAALASVAESAVFCDNDVDAADLHLLFQPRIMEDHIFLSAWIAEIEDEKCNACGICFDKCRFNSIHQDEAGRYSVNPFQCEGCKLCERICPEQAIHSTQSDKNHWYISDSRFGTLVHAAMGPGEENSGKLVTEVREQAKAIALQEAKDYIINDGPPGIGCTAISSLTGTDAVLLVIEATRSGWHDAKRLSQLIKSFGIEAYAIINKYDINLEVTTVIEEDLKNEGIPLLAKIAFDTIMVDALTAGKTVVEFAPESYIAQQIEKVWQQLK